MKGSDLTKNGNNESEIGSPKPDVEQEREGGCSCDSRRWRANNIGGDEFMGLMIVVWIYAKPFISTKSCLPGKDLSSLSSVTHIHSEKMVHEYISTKYIKRDIS